MRFDQPACPECLRMGTAIFTRNGHNPFCDGEEITCHTHCPVQEQYLDMCQTCGGKGWVTYEELVAWVDARELDPLEKSVLIEDCLEGVNDSVTSNRT